jgi:hypothetical protein
MDIDGMSNTPYLTFNHTSKLWDCDYEKFFQYRLNNRDSNPSNPANDVDMSISPSASIIYNIKDYPMDVEDDILHGETIPNKYHWPEHNYAGPGTDIAGQINNNVLPIDKDDYISFLHDVDYANSTNYDDIASADEVYISRLKALRSEMMNKNQFTTTHADIFAQLMALKRPYNAISKILGHTPNHTDIDMTKVAEIQNDYDKHHPNDPMIPKHIGRIFAPI